MTTTFECAKVGDSVWSAMHEKWGIISEIKDEGVYCIVCYIPEAGEMSFTKDGRYTELSVMQVLFWDEVPRIVAPEKKIKLSIDDLIEVKMCCSGAWVKRYATGKVKDGKVYCWANGATSHTAEGLSIPWDVFRLPITN